jgi:hypothetical protein
MKMKRKYGKNEEILITVLQGGTSTAVSPLSKHSVDALRFIHPAIF